MLYQRVKTTIALAAGLGLITGLVGCRHHENPLKKADPTDTATFLVRASQAAEKQLKVYQNSGGFYYGQCMRGKRKQALCAKLYRAMASFAATSKPFKQFKGITIADLTDQNFFTWVKEEYERVNFNTID